MDVLRERTEGKEKKKRKEKEDKRYPLTMNAVRHVRPALGPLPPRCLLGAVRGGSGYGTTSLRTHSRLISFSLRMSVGGGQRRPCAQVFPLVVQFSFSCAVRRPSPGIASFGDLCSAKLNKTERSAHTHSIGGISASVPRPGVRTLPAGTSSPNMLACSLSSQDLIAMTMLGWQCSQEAPPG